MLQARVRARPAPKTQTPYGYPVIGGPKPPDNTPETAVWPVGSFHMLGGKPINTWPWRTGSAIIGIIYHEYTRNAKNEWVFVSTHIYELHEKTWRYMGKAKSWNDARQRLDEQYEKRRAATQVVQPVAARARSRPVV